MRILTLDPKPLHEWPSGPDAPEQGLRGSASVREALQHQGELLVVSLPSGVQVLNVDSRAVLLTR